MPIISQSDAAGIFTKSLVGVLKEAPTPKSFLRSFFKETTSSTKEISIEVQRGTEKIAVDVERGEKGNANKFAKSTEKIIIPPLYSEYFNLTELDLYDRLFGSTGIEESVLTNLIQDTIDKTIAIKAKIERAYELQCSQVFHNGVVTLASGDNIDFKRKNTSIFGFWLYFQLYKRPTQNY